MKLWHKVLIGLVAGVILGLISKGDHANIDLLKTYIKPVGDIFLRMIMMVVAPLVYFSLVQGVTSVSDPASLGRIGIKATAAFLMTTMFAILIGMICAIIFKPGEGIVLNLGNIVSDQVNKAGFSFVSLIVNIVPNNIVDAFSEARMLQVVFFAIFTGITLNYLSGEERKVIELFHQISKMIFKMMSIIMNLSPYGAFALTTMVVATQGIDVLKSLGNLVLAVLFAMFVQYLVFGIIIRLFAKISPFPFYKKSFEYQALAFSTSSSKATLATTMKICRDKLGISNSSTSFILPLGASINMDGIAIYLGMTAIFFAQIYGITLSLNDYLIIALTATLGSIGGAGIPGGSMVMLPMILSSVNLPIEGVALIAGIDRLLDMLRTVINITGDVTVTLIVDKSEGSLNEELYMS